MTFPYRTLLARLLGRNLTADDEVPLGRLAGAEQRLGFRLPNAMTDFYSSAGAAPEFQAHNRLRAPETLEMDDGLLVFMEENQHVVDWGIRPVGHEPDPEVWQRVNEPQAEWYSEGMPFSVFIVKNLAFTRGTDLSDDDLHGDPGNRL